MQRLRTVLHSLARQPRYTLMRGVARFSPVRSMVAGARAAAHATSRRRLLSQLTERADASPFARLEREEFVRQLRRDGVAFGLQLPVGQVSAILAWADREPCYADRDPRAGFMRPEVARAEAALGKPILLAQYFNAAASCEAVSRLVGDPVLRWIAASYLGSMPTFVGANLWWTFPAQASAADRDRHAHLFHRDVDDFRFFKYFFYLTDVPPGEGAHVCVAGSHREPLRTRAGDPWNLRRYGDDEVHAFYGRDRIQEVCGPAGTGFAEDTLCVHKGSTPVSTPRLLLQLQYALFDYDAMHDRRTPSELGRLFA
jgi:hypothetical protein